MVLVISEIISISLYCYSILSILIVIEKHGIFKDKNVDTKTHAYTMIKLYSYTSHMWSLFTSCGKQSTIFFKRLVCNRKTGALMLNWFTDSPSICIQSNVIVDTNYGVLNN